MEGQEQKGPKSKRGGLSPDRTGDLGICNPTLYKVLDNKS